MSNYPTNDNADFMDELMKSEESNKSTVSSSVSSSTSENNEMAIVNSENNAEMQRLLENAELAMLFNKTGTAGSEELGGTLPVLKIHTLNKSKNTLMNGEEPQDGYLFHTVTRKEYEFVDAHIVAVSKGYYAPAIEEGNKDVFTQLVSGYILDEGEYVPFIMYVTGTKLQNFWEFGKEINPYTHMKPTPLPMYAIKVRIYGNKERVDTDYGKVKVFTFKVQRSEAGFPLFEMDEGRAKFLADSVDQFKDQMNNIISKKSVSDDAIEAETL